MASLETRIRNLSTRLGTEFKAVRAEMDAIGGGAGHDATDPESAIRLVDDFIGGSTESGEIGELGWSFTNGTIIQRSPVVSNHPGIIRRTSTTTASQYNSLYLTNGVAAGPILFEQFDEMRWIFSPILTDLYNLRIGACADASSGAPSHGFFIWKDASLTNYYIMIVNGATSQTFEVKACVSGEWTKVKFRRVAAGQMRFSIDGGSEVTANGAYVPDGADMLQPFATIQPTTTAARSFDLDFFSMKLVAPTR